MIPRGIIREVSKALDSGIIPGDRNSWQDFETARKIAGQRGDMHFISGKTKIGRNVGAIVFYDFENGIRMKWYADDET